MSTEEDDREEEELLQMALREQSKWEINYHRIAQNRLAKRGAPSPSSTAPHPLPAIHRNSTQQPSSRSQHKQPRSNSNPAQAYRAPPSQAKVNKAQKSAVRDDEESEVEMLSISSDDEDFPPQKQPSGLGRGVSGSNLSKNSWDAEEADCWKRVDEAELARRVRELRDTKVVPLVTQARLRGKNANAVGTAALLPRGGTEQPDPLGLGIVDLKTLTLIRDDGKNSPQDTTVFRDSNLREKVMYQSEKFDAKYFLSRIHQNTSSADLERGGSILKTDLFDKTQQRKQLVKENFDCFVSCKTTIDDIQVKLKQIEEDPEGAGTIHLNKAIQHVDGLAKYAFGSLFERQVKAEKIRSVQGILQRFRTLFNLPSTIRRSINKGEYDLAVREYRKAKSIVLPSHVGVLKRVMEEVEKVVLEFKGMLYQSMEDPEIDLSNLEHTIMLLLELEPESDPIWHYLNVQNRRIHGLLESCSIDYDIRMDALNSLLRDRVLSDARWKQIQQESNKNCLVDYSILLSDNGCNLKESNGREADALRGRLVHTLTAVFVHHVPMFWRLALSIFTGKFAKLSQIGSSNGYPELGKQRETSSKHYVPDDRPGEWKYLSHSLDEVASMVEDVVNVYEVKVQNAFQELDESNIHCPYMREALCEIAKAYTTLEGIESAPKSAVLKLFGLRAEVMTLFVSRICSWMKTKTLDIVYDENWIPVSFLERNRSSFAISHLPISFHENMVTAMDQISQMVDTIRQDSYRPHDKIDQVQEMQNSVKFTFFNCFLDFIGTLERLSSDVIENTSKEQKMSANGYVHVPGDKFNGLQPGVLLKNPDQKLLMILGNIGYCKNETLSKLCSKYKLIWGDLSMDITEEERDKEIEADIMDLSVALCDSEEKVLTQYVNSKANMIRQASELYLSEDGFQWGGAPSVKGVRDAAIELLHPLVAVHAEVYAGSRPYLEKTINILVEALMDTLLGILAESKTSALKSLDVNGYCQLMLELDYFEFILHSYFTTTSQDALKHMRELLLETALDSVNMDERQQESTLSPDYLIELAHGISSDFLQLELKRTQMNFICFRETCIQLDSVSDTGRNSYQPSNGMKPLPNNQVKANQPVGSASFSHHRRKLSASSLSDSDSGRPFTTVHPYSPRNHHGYASSDVGSESGSMDARVRGSVIDRFAKSQSELRYSRRASRIADDDLR